RDLHFLPSAIRRCANLRRTQLARRSHLPHHAPRAYACRLHAEASRLAAVSSHFLVNAFRHPVALRFRIFAGSTSPESPATRSSFLNRNRGLCNRGCRHLPLLLCT